MCNVRVGHSLGFFCHKKMVSDKVIEDFGIEVKLFIVNIDKKILVFNIIQKGNERQ